MDADCIRRCLNGHRDDYRQLVVRYERALTAMLRGRGLSREGAEDVRQEGFIRAFRQLDRKRTDQPFFPWLAGIAIRVAHEMRRMDQRSPKASTLRNAADIPQADPSSDDREDDEVLIATVTAMPDPYRDVVLLRYFAGLSCAEVAECLEIPLGTVTKRLSRAHAMLRERLNSNTTRNEIEVRR